MTRVLRILVFFALAFALSSRIATADVWADMYGSTSTTGNMQGSRYNPYSTIKPPLVLLWSHTGLKTNLQYGSVENSSPAVADGIVYLGGANGISDYDALYAWSTDTGSTVPGFPAVTGDIYTSPVIANGNVYCNYGNILASYNAYNGSYRAGFPVYPGVISIAYSNPVVDHGKVYFSGDGNLNAWDEATGAVIQGFPVYSSCYSCELITPMISNNVIF